MIIAFVGDNTHDREQAAQDFIKSFIKIHGNLAVDKYRAEEITVSQLLDNIKTPPFLTQKRMVIVRDFGQNKTLAESLGYVSNEIADTTDLVIIDSRPNARSKYLTDLKKYSEYRDFTQLDQQSLVKWIIDYTTKHGGIISSYDASYLVDRVGTNQLQIASELEKLILFDANISKENINLLTSYNPTSSIFSMLDALFNGDLKKALQLYDEQLQQGMDDRYILSMIIWQLNNIAIVSTAGPMSSSEIVSKSKLSPYVVRKSQTIVNKLTKNKILNLYNCLIKTDMAIKTHKSNPHLAVKKLLIQIAN